MFLALLAAFFFLLFHAALLPLLFLRGPSNRLLYTSRTADLWGNVSWFHLLRTIERRRRSRPRGRLTWINSSPNLRLAATLPAASLPIELSAALRSVGWRQ